MRSQYGSGSAHSALMALRRRVNRLDETRKIRARIMESTNPDGSPRHSCSCKGCDDNAQIHIDEQHICNDCWDDFIVKTESRGHTLTFNMLSMLLERYAQTSSVNSDNEDDTEPENDSDVENDETDEDLENVDKCDSHDNDDENTIEYTEI